VQPIVSTTPLHQKLTQSLSKKQVGLTRQDILTSSQFINILREDKEARKCNKVNMIHSVTKNEPIVALLVDYMLPQTEKEFTSTYRGHSELRQHIVESDTSSKTHKTFSNFNDTSY
jgi:hypothetical protein